MTQALDLFDDIVDDASVPEMRVGQIGTCKGKLENIRYGGGRTTARSETQNANWGDPSLTIAFADWGMLAVTLRDYATAKGIRIPLGTYVGVKVQKIHEDGDLMALAIWELGDGGAVIPLGEPCQVT